MALMDRARVAPSEAPGGVRPGDSPRRLLTIRFSHYCEKARWALDRAGVSYEEEAHPPIVSWLFTKRLKAAGARSRARQVPILVAEGKVYPDSNDILAYADAHTPGQIGALCHLPDGEARDLAKREKLAELRKLFDESLGPAARRFVYGVLLDDAAVASRVLASAGSPIERHIARATFPLLRTAIRKGLKIDAAGVERSRKVIERVFATVEEAIRDGRPYLLGDTFTAADLSFASLAAPILFPDVYATFCLPLDEGPRALVPLVNAYRATPAGRFALSLYERDRGVPQEARS